MENFINYENEIENFITSIKSNSKKKFISGESYIPSAGKIIDKNALELV